MDCQVCEDLEGYSFMLFLSPFFLLLLLASLSSLSLLCAALCLLSPPSFPSGGFLSSSFPSPVLVFMKISCSDNLMRVFVHMVFWHSWKDHAPQEDHRVLGHVKTLELPQYNILQLLCLHALHGILLKEWVWQG